jgi:SAM-dependent methyltransferase
MASDKYKDIVRHYESCFDKFGDSHKGVDWPNLEDAEKRYRIMLGVIRENSASPVSLLDFGCGLAHMFEYILKAGLGNMQYSGLDISESFVKASKLKYPENNFYTVDILKNPEAIPVFDYIVMNGVFTEKREMSFDEMWTYFKEMLSVVFPKCTKGIAFNVMSKAVDWEREDLFHLPVDLLIDFLTKNLSRNFVVRNDYGLYEYTVYVYK